MKTLIFSDVHLSNKFDERKFYFLKKIIASADRVIINGDFWESTLTDFTGFIHSPYNALFPLLLAKQTVYIYGNHDTKELCDNRVGLYSTKQVKQYRIAVGNKILHIEHGDRICPIFDDESNFFIALTRKHQRLTQQSFDILENILVKLFKRHGINFLYKRFDFIIRQYSQKHLKENEILVCGHTHTQVSSSNYLNSGFIRHGIGQYILIEGNKISVEEEHY